uniref:NADH dehydrogenase subunit 6 n=1 Tax=Viviparus chui TaxID=2023714 RepID=A0A343FMR2_9CAEN|nr:NADH dehydrogenase subunit 6 [Viviparus chui]ASR74842.1 NADH dehydrogenase subunit 6 [Viviparus chui]
MTVLIMSSVGLTFSFVIPLMAQPLSLGFSIIMFTLLMCILISMFLSSWYAYILFLIYVGGLLVMFAYVAALIPNIMMSMSSSMFLFFVIQICIMYVYTYCYFIDSKSLVMYNYVAMVNMKMTGIELVSPEFISIMISLGVILLINLVVVVKICYHKYSVMRPFLV